VPGCQAYWLVIGSMRMLLELISTAIGLGAEDVDSMQSRAV
jgi:hypothetical protein